MSKSKRAISLAVGLGMLAGSAIGQAAVAADAEAPAPIEITEPVTLEFWFQSDVLAETESWQRAIDRFGEVQPNVTINMTSIPFTDFERQMPLALGAGTGPDVATVPPLASGQDRYVAAGHLVDLTPIAEERGWLDHYPEWAVAYNNAATPGQVYGIPYAITDEGMFYDGDLFAEMGLEAPQSFEELEALLQTLSEAGMTPLSVGGRDGWPLVNDWGHFVQGNIPNEYAIELEALNPDYTYDDPRIIEATEKFVEWFQKGYFEDNSVATDYNTANSMFVNEEVGMTLTGTWALAQFIDEADFEARYFAFPPIDPAVGWNDSGLAPYNNIVIPKDTSNQDAAVAFLDYILGEENQQAFWDEGNLVSYQFDPLPAPANAVQADVYEAMNKGVAGRYMGVSSPEMLQAFTTNLQNAVNGDITAEEAIKEIEKVYRTVVDA